MYVITFFLYKTYSATEPMYKFDI